MPLFAGASTPPRRSDTFQRGCSEMTYRKIAALLLVCLVAACDDPAVPSPAAVEFAFDIERLQTEPRFVVSEGQGEITVRGDMRTPCMGYEARAEADRALRTVEVRIIGVDVGLC